MNKVILIFILLSLISPLSAQNVQSADTKALRLQVFLDQNNFAGGKIDGIGGEFTDQALKYYQSVHPDKSDNALDNDLKTLNPLTTYTLNEEDKKYIGNVPEKLAAQAQMKTIPYKTYAEFVSERFHMDPDLLAKLNPDVNLKNLQPGDQLSVPNVEPFRIEKLKSEKFKKQSKFKHRIIKVNIEKRMLTLYDGDKLLAVFPITPGSDTLPAPKGQWKLQSITYLPWFRYDKKMLKEGKRSENYHNIPPGPNNMVGVVWMALNKKGIGIHGTDSPETIGRSVSHGCIRLSNWDAIKLSHMITPGIPVQID